MASFRDFIIVNRDDNQLVELLVFYGKVLNLQL